MSEPTKNRKPRKLLTIPEALLELVHLYRARNPGLSFTGAVLSLVRKGLKGEGLL